MKKKKNINDSLIAVEPHISGCSGLENLIIKWEIEADKIKAMVDDVNHPKSHRQTFNHFLIQLLKCIAEAKVELKNNR